MDVAYNQFASVARRKNRSTTNLNHLTLAPLTSKLPLTDPDDLPDPLSAPPHATSYLEGKSAPTTPGLLSRSPGRSHSHTRNASTPAASLPKSKSTTHLIVTPQRRNGSASPQHVRRRKDEPFSANDDNDTDWLLRAGALISTETRESKGQAWLVSRASSTSLTGVRDIEEETFERELAREREMTSRQVSRRGSLVIIEDDQRSSPPHSRFGSRSHSRVGLRGQQLLLSPSEQQLHHQQRRSVDGYFPSQYDEEGLVGPDFVNLDEKLELESAIPDTAIEDEAHVRRLVKRGNAGVGTWFGNVLGFQLFSVEENEEESDVDGNDDGDITEGENNDDTHLERRRSSARQFDSLAGFSEDHVPPPKADEGGWQDAAWLLSVATKVLL